MSYTPVKIKIDSPYDPALAEFFYFHKKQGDQVFLSINGNGLKK